MTGLKLTNLFRGSLILSIVSLTLLGTGCGGKKERIEDKQDTVLVDTIPVDTIAAEEDSLKTYYSDDLKSFGIRGNVMERSAMRHGAETIYPEPTMELTFDEEGNFTGSLRGLYPKKNEDGFFYSYSMNYEDGTSWELTYTDFNDNFFPTKAEIFESGPQGVAKSEIAYTGYEYDGEGNWVLRTVTMHRDFTETDTEEKTSTSYKWKELVSYKYKDKKEADKEKDKKEGEKDQDK